jgi:hypothetical protein
VWPELSRQRMTLDLDGSECDFHSWSHDRYYELLCMGPTHIPKSWKNQIAKLKLPSDKAKLLLSLIWKFALMTELCDCNQLDAEWEEITRTALRLAGFSTFDDLTLIPDKFCLALKNPCQDTEAGLELSSDGASTAWVHEAAPLEIVELVDSISSGIRSLNDESTSEGEILQDLRSKLDVVLMEISQKRSQSELQQKCSKIAVQRIQQSFQKGKGQKGNGTASKDTPMVTRELVLEAMQHIYSLAHTWCQRIVCSGHNMQRKSSTWSEILNSSIKRYVEVKKFLGGTYMLSHFVADVDQWTHNLFEKSYAKSRIFLDLSSQILSPVHVCLLEQVLCQGALKKLLSTLLPKAIQKEYCISKCDQHFEKSVCKTMKSRLNIFKRTFNVDDFEVQFFRVKSKVDIDYKTIYQGSLRISRGGEMTEGHDVVNGCLQEASRLAASTSTGSVLAVYFPTDGACKIPFFNQTRPRGSSIPFFCSCQQQPSSGLPCEHMLAYILQPDMEFPRSVWNIIWLCHPTFIRGHA